MKVKREFLTGRVVMRGQMVDSVVCAVTLMKAITTICFGYDFDRGLDDRLWRHISCFRKLQYIMFMLKWHFCEGTHWLVNEDGAEWCYKGQKHAMSGPFLELGIFLYKKWATVFTNTVKCTLPFFLFSKDAFSNSKDFYIVMYITKNYI